MHRINRSPCLVPYPMSRLKLTGVVIDEANFENQTLYILYEYRLDGV